MLLSANFQHFTVYSFPDSEPVTYTAMATDGSCYKAMNSSFLYYGPLLLGPQ